MDDVPVAIIRNKMSLFIVRVLQFRIEFVFAGAACVSNVEQPISQGFYIH